MRFGEENSQWTSWQDAFPIIRPNTTIRTILRRRVPKDGFEAAKNDFFDASTEPTRDKMRN